MKQNSEYNYQDIEFIGRGQYISWYHFPAMKNEFIFVNSKYFLIVTPFLQK